MSVYIIPAKLDYFSQLHLNLYVYVQIYDKATERKHIVYRISKENIDESLGASTEDHSYVFSIFLPFMSLLVCGPCSFLVYTTRLSFQFLILMYCAPHVCI